PIEHVLGRIDRGEDSDLGWRARLPQPYQCVGGETGGGPDRSRLGRGTSLIDNGLRGRPPDIRYRERIAPNTRAGSQNNPTRAATQYRHQRGCGRRAEYWIVGRHPHDTRATPAVFKKCAEAVGQEPA